MNPHWTDWTYAGVVALALRLGVTVDGETRWVPRSAHMDLFNARAAAILFEQGSFVLSIAGADGADAYQVRVYFDSKKIVRRAAFNLEDSAEKPSQETRYAARRSSTHRGTIEKLRPCADDKQAETSNLREVRLRDSGVSLHFCAQGMWILFVSGGAKPPFPTIVQSGQSRELPQHKEHRT
jgi:hypothetical protein